MPCIFKFLLKFLQDKQITGNFFNRNYVIFPKENGPTVIIFILVGYIFKIFVLVPSFTNHVKYWYALSIPHGPHLKSGFFLSQATLKTAFDISCRTKTLTL